MASNIRIRGLIASKRSRKSGCRFSASSWCFCCLNVKPGRRLIAAAGWQIASSPQSYTADNGNFGLYWIDRATQVAHWFLNQTLATLSEVRDWNSTETIERIWWGWTHRLDIRRISGILSKIPGLISQPAFDRIQLWKATIRKAAACEPRHCFFSTQL